MTNNNFNNNEDYSDKDDIEFQYYFKIIRRNKKIIFFTTLITTLLATIYCYSVKPKWKGSFNILVENINRNDFFGKSNDIRTGLIPLNTLSNNNNNKTEELVLKSPSVLMPVYEYVQKYYLENKINKKLRSFNNWAEKDINVTFKKGTNVFTVEYESESKDLILNVLNLVSEKYKNYSKKDSEKELQKTMSYLLTQKDLMKKKANNSLNIFNKFSIENGLGDFDGFGFNSEERNSIRRLNDSYIKENLDNNNKIFKQDFTNRNPSNDANQRFTSQFALLEKYESEYMDLSSVLKPNSLYLKDLQKNIDNMKSLLKKPSEILVKFNYLKKESNRDQELLEEILQKIELVKLEKIKSPEAWSIISEPTLEDYKVFPNKRAIIPFTFISSFILIFIISIIKEKLSSRIYDNEILLKDLNLPYLETINPSNKFLIPKLIRKVINLEIKDFSLQDIKFVNYTSLSNSQLKSLIDLEENNKIFFDIYDFNEVENNSNICFLIEEGFIRKNDLDVINKYIYLFREKFIGWFLFYEK